MDSNPMISINVRVWVKLGYLYPSDNRSVYTVIPLITMGILQLFYCLFSREDKYSVTLNAYFTALSMNCMSRVLITLGQRLKFEKFLEDMTTLYQGILNSGSEEDKKILDTVQFRATLFSRLNMSLASLACFLFLSYPVIVGRRVLPYGLWIPGVDFSTSPAYELGYLFGVYATMCAVSQYIPFVNMFMVFVLFGITIVQILAQKLKNIAGGPGIDREPDNALIEKRFRLYIEFHKRIIRYVEEMNQLVSMVCLIEIILFGMLLMALLFTVVMAEKRSQVLLGCIYIFMIIFQLFAIYYLSNELIEESGAMGYALYDSPWYTFSIRNQKTALLVIARTQRPLEVMIGNVAPITLQTFQSILNVSYSYFNILQGGLKN